jgi:hypothetical protein
MALMAQAASELPEGTDLQEHEQFLKNLMTGMISAPVPVRKHSSAINTS